MGKQNQIVVYAQPQKKKKKSGKKKKGQKQRMVQFITQKKPRRPQSRGVRSMSQALQQFQLAMRNPFSADALGVRVVDAVCYPTTVSHLRYKITCTTTAGGAFQAVLLPFLHANAILVAGTTSGNPGVYANNPSVSYAATAATLKSFFTCYRVAAWGVRVILTDSNQNAKGTYTLAPIMLSGNVPGENTLVYAAANTAALCSGFGVPVPTEAIASMPAAVAVNAQDMMTKGELVARGLCYNASAYDMKQISNTGVFWNAANTSWFAQGPHLWNGAAGVETETVETNGAGRADGQCAYLLSVANAPASTAEFQLEFIYHIEGVPQPSSGVVMTSTPSPAGSTSTMERVLSAMVSASEYFQMGTQIAERLGNLGTSMYQFNSRARYLLR